MVGVFRPDFPQGIVMPKPRRFIPSAAAPAGGPVTIDVSGGSIVGSANGTLGLTVASDADFLLACVYHDSATDGSTPSSAAWNASAMTRVTSFDTHDGVQLHLYKLLNPAPGAHTLSVTGAPGADTCGIKAISFKGANQATPLGTAVTSGATSGTNDPNPAVTCAGATAGIAVAFVGGWNQALQIVTLLELGSGQSIVDSIINNLGDNMSMSKMDGAASNAFSWNMNKAGANFIDSCAIAVCVLPA